MLTYLLIQWRHIVTMSHNTFHSSRVIDKRQRRRLANVDIQLRHLVTIRSPNSFHSGHLAITVTLRGPDGDRYGQVLLYMTLARVDNAPCKKTGEFSLDLAEMRPVNVVTLLLCHLKRPLRYGGYLCNQIQQNNVEMC